MTLLPTTKVMRRSHALGAENHRLMRAGRIRLNSGWRRSVTRNNPCIKLPADRPFCSPLCSGYWKTPESNFRFRCYRTPMNAAGFRGLARGRPIAPKRLQQVRQFRLLVSLRRDRPPGRQVRPCLRVATPPRRHQRNLGNGQLARHQRPPSQGSRRYAGRPWPREHAGCHRCAPLGSEGPST